MTSTNTYKDTKAVDYLEAIKRNQLESRNSKSSSSSFDMTYMLPRTSAISIATTTEANAQTLADYMVGDNTAKQILFLPFDLDVNDASNSNDGTVTGAETYIVVSPEISSTHPARRAFDFDGATYITIANESNFDFNRTDTFSIGARINSHDPMALDNLLLETGDIILAENNDMLSLESVQDQIIISKIASFTTPGYYAYISYDNIIHFIIQNSTSDKIEVKTTTAIDTAYNHILITYSGSGAASGVKIYINGVNNTLTTVTDTSTATALNNTSLIIGALGDATYKFTGYMDDIQVWNVIVTSDEAFDMASGIQINRNTSVTKPAVLGLSDVT
jgi:hypothetical protein